MLIPMGRENVVVVSEIVGAVVDVIINALLIPKYGASGAAIGTVTAEFAVLAVQAIAAACASDSSLEACVGSSSIFDSMHSNSRNWFGEFCDIDGVCSSFLWHLPDCFNFAKGTIYTRVCAYGDKIFIT